MAKTKDSPMFVSREASYYLVCNVCNTQFEKHSGEATTLRALALKDSWETKIKDGAKIDLCTVCSTGEFNR